MVQGPAASTDVRGCRRARRRPGLAVRGNRAVHCDHVRADELHGAAGTHRHLSVDRAQLRHEHLYRRRSRDHGAGLSRQDLRRGLQQRHDHRARPGRNLRSLDAEERRADRRQERGRMRSHDSGLLRPEGDLQLRREQRVLEHDRADQPHLPLDSFDCLRLVRRHRRQPAEGLDRKRIRRCSTRQPVVRRQDGRDGRPRQAGAQRQNRDTALLSGLRHHCQQRLELLLSHHRLGRLRHRKRRLVGAGRPSAHRSLRDVHRIRSCGRRPCSVAPPTSASMSSRSSNRTERKLS